MLLAIETSQGDCSVALLDGDRVTASAHLDERTRQAERLLPMIEQILAEAGTGYDALTHVACVTGPGSFTGVRIGLATAQGIELAAGIPGIGVSMLEACAWHAIHELPGNGTIAVLRNAMREEVYHQRFDRNLAPLSEPVMASVADAASWADSLPEGTVFTGNGLHLIGREAPLPPPDAVWAGRVARHLLKNGRTEQHPLLPLYIRKPDAKLPALKPDRHATGPASE